eukprot:11289112-Ditylum_brightwellii.AAC.1
MITNDKVFGAQGYPRKLKVGKLQSCLVILLNCGVDALCFLGDAKGSGGFLKELLQRDQLASRSGKGDILALHCNLGNDGL